MDDVVGERGALEVINHCPGMAIGGDKIHYPGVGARGPIFRLEFAGSVQQAVAGNRAEKRPGGKANGAASGKINAELTQGDGRRQQPGTVSNRLRAMHVGDGHKLQGDTERRRQIRNAGNKRG